MFVDGFFKAVPKGARAIERLGANIAKAGPVDVQRAKAK